MKLPGTKAVPAFVLIMLLIGALVTLAAALSCRSPHWYVSPLGFVRLQCAGASNWRLNFNLFVCVPWPLILIGTAVVRWVRGRK